MSNPEEQVLVRWLCWNLEDATTELTEPEFEVVSPAVTEEQLRAELPEHFPDVRIVVDDDIDL